ncbi:MAG: DRTGG domain-containing protein [Planctomycetota bacterium]|jgi:predicted transcriptional regulator
MLLDEICKILEADMLSDVKGFDREINMVCGSDLMSDVLTFVKSGSLLLTGLTNTQVVRTAEMAELGAVCFVNNKRPQKGTITLANEKKIPLLATKLFMYECCGRLYKKGLSGTDDSE